MDADQHGIGTGGWDGGFFDGEIFEELGGEVGVGGVDDVDLVGEGHC